MSLSSGTRLGPYEIVAPIGAGGMGEVYRALDTRLGRTVAIKVSSSEFSDRFQREARAVAALNHPNICTLHDVGPGYLVMEYIEGQPVKGPLPLQEAVRIGVQIADALQTAHESGIVHRDLKPANILLSKSGIKLLDFGLARSESLSSAEETMAQTQAGAILGTPAYMSPEQAEGRTVDVRSDIFSFGVVLYELLSGRRAFHGESTFSTIASILRDEPPALETSAEIQGIVTRCLRKRPSERYRNAAELKAALTACGGGAERAASIAVLPFSNLSGDKENEYFSDGLAEEILIALNQVPGLRVIARASAFAFRGREHEVAAIREKLQATHLLHGSVRRSGARIRVNAQLVAVRDESQLWSERYDREMRDLFDIQDEIALAIVENLKTLLGTAAVKPLVKRYTDNPEARTLYLKGNHHLYRLNGRDMEIGREYLERVVALEPGYAPAWVQLADYAVAAAFFGSAIPSEIWPATKEKAQKAIAADPQLAEAHAVMGYVVALSEYKWKEAERLLGHSLQMSTVSARCHFWHGQLFAMRGRLDEALKSLRRAIDLDPLSPLFRWAISGCHLFAGQVSEAGEEMSLLLDLDPEYAIALAVQGEIKSLAGQHREGLDLIGKAREKMAGDFWPAAFHAWIYVRSGAPAEAEKYLAGLEERSLREFVPPSTMLLAALALGNVAKAFDFAELAITQRDPTLPFMIFGPYAKSFRNDPRFAAIERKLGLDTDRAVL